MIKKSSICTFIAAILAGICYINASNPSSDLSSKDDSGNLRLLYWNIQNGMWCGQDDNYDKFVEFVKKQNPDICVWCEASTIYKNGTADNMAQEDRYLPEHWDELAKRYGHNYWYKGAHRDNYPQVITSRYPIENIDRFVGAAPDSIVSHGAGWARINVNGNDINIVALHTWPQRYAFGVNTKEGRDSSAAVNGGDRYRRMEMEYICRHTIETAPQAENEMWMMMGDFNSVSRVDAANYSYAPDATAYLCHDYIRENTPYIDAISEFHKGKFMPTTGSRKSRIDFVYLTPPLMNAVKNVQVIFDEYTTPVRDSKGLSNFWHPSDHCPILIDFKLK